MRLRASVMKNKFHPGRRKGLLDLSVSICVRLEIIAILSGFHFPSGKRFRRPVVMPFRPAVSVPPPTNPMMRLIAG